MYVFLVLQLTPIISIWVDVYILIRVRGLPARLSYPLHVWGWGWAGAGNSSELAAVLAVAAAAPPRGKKENLIVSQISGGRPSKINTRRLKMKKWVSSEN